MCGGGPARHIPAPTRGIISVMAGTELRAMCEGTASGAISDDTPIWRYMDLPKFVSMLASGGLRFTKAAILRDDPYEGFCRAEPAGMLSVGPGPVSVEHMIAQLGRISAESCRNARDRLYVNSWCLASESMAMWEIYGSRGCGLAVKSTVGQYQRAARFPVSSSHYAFGEVKYHGDLESSPDIQRDFSEGPIPMGSNLWNELLKLAFHKRACYDYEKEWRAALYQDPRPEIAGVDIPFDLQQLISAVYVGPRAENFFFDVVLSVMDKFLLRKPLERSVLLDGPRSASSAKA